MQKWRRGALTSKLLRGPRNLSAALRITALYSLFKISLSSFFLSNQGSNLSFPCQFATLYVDQMLVIYQIKQVSLFLIYSQLFCVHLNRRVSSIVKLGGGGILEN